MEAVEKEKLWKEIYQCVRNSEPTTNGWSLIEQNINSNECIIKFTLKSWINGMKGNEVY